MGPNIEEELAGLQPAVLRDPRERKGRWAQLEVDGAQRREPFAQVALDLGSGMGDYLVALGAREPDTLFVGVEKELFCVAKSAAKVLDAGLRNVVFVPSRDAAGNDVTLSDIFAEGELDRLLINFPTPHARKADASLRMTHLDALAVYRHLLAPGSTMRLKTDSRPFFDFTLEELHIAGYEVLWQTDDLHGTDPDDPITGYEQRLSGKGARILALEVVPGPEPAEMVQTEQLSLFDYLPEDLESLTYIPADMERSVRNAIEARARVKANRKRRQRQI